MQFLGIVDALVYRVPTKTAISSFGKVALTRRHLAGHGEGDCPWRGIKVMSTVPKHPTCAARPSGRAHLHGRDTLGYMAIVPLEALRQAIRSAWSADTSAAAAWTESNRAKGQCAVTACVVNDHLGGEILHTTATLPSGDTVSHYFNLIDGRPVDLTAEQFPEHTQFSEPAPKTKGFASTREFCLSYEHTKQRYELLRARVAEHLTG